jgi:uncharacterized protein
MDSDTSSATPPAPPAVPPPTSLPTPRTVPSGNDKIWAIFSHLSGYIGLPILIPLVVYLAMRNESSYAAENAKEALNFHISAFIYALCCIPLAFLLIGVPLLVALGLAVLVFSIVAAIKASDGSVYRYPLTIRLVK